MAVPSFSDFFIYLLKAIEDGELHTLKEVSQTIAGEMQLSDEDMQELLPSGKQPRYINRILWARTYLGKAGLVETPQRGKYRITETGLEALNSGDKIDLKFLDRYESFRAFRNTSQFESQDIEDEDENESPVEILEAAFSQIESSLASDLMEEVMKLTPHEFEKMVVRLLLQMGYGNGIEKAGFVTQASNDGGIDGIVKEDQLGFSNIYIQAKQWSAKQTVQKPEIQKFVGALQGKQAQKGLFITTASFSSGAIQYANNLLGVKVVLIDGQDLTKLMIKHNVGVSLEQIYEIKKIDSDFFMDEL